MNTNKSSVKWKVGRLHAKHSSHSGQHSGWKLARWESRLSGYRTIQWHRSQLLSNAHQLGLCTAYYTCQLHFSFEQQLKVDLRIIGECILSMHFYSTQHLVINDPI